MYGAPGAYGAPAPYGQPGPRRTHLAAAVRPPSGTGFFAMALLSMKRAFRLRIDANEILDDERDALLKARPAVTDEDQQAFLAWRRSVLFMAALIMIPVALVHAAQVADQSGPEGWKALNSLAVIVEIAFTVFLWIQVPRWTKWKKQSRALSWAWLLYFLTPFLIFLYPVASSMNYDDYGPAGSQARQMAQFTAGLAIGAQAMISLAPKIISLLQGMIRASIATKTLFPGSSAPGWLMVISAPLYMIIFYVFVLLPYHFTDSGLVAVGMLLILGAKSTLVRAGLHLTRPMRDEEARNSTSKALTLWFSMLALGALCIIGGLWDLISQASPNTVINFALSMASNILLLTLIATDGLITGLDRGRGTTADERALAEEVHGQLAAFTLAGSQEGAQAEEPRLPPPPSAPPGAGGPQPPPGPPPSGPPMAMPAGRR